jgi:hypothetical protein
MTTLSFPAPNVAVEARSGEPRPWRPAAEPHQGMPPLDQDGPPLSYFEFWPMWAFYPPVVAYALWLMLRHRSLLLPSAANPAFPGGGFVGESKAEILGLARRALGDLVAPFVVRERAADASRSPAEQAYEALAALATAGIELPVVAKPDLGCRGAGVKLVRTAQDLERYVREFPAGATYLLQKLVPFEGEAGIFYCRRPAERGRIVSITLKYFPYVRGNGLSSLRELIHADPRAGRLSHLYLKRHRGRLDEVPPAGEPVRLAFAGSHSRGAIFRDGTPLLTPAMEEAFEHIAQRLPEFHFGRFDIRFADFAEVQQGRGFTIVEVNGAGAESTHIWDRRTTLAQAWAALLKQYRWLFEIGAANRRRGFAPMRLADFWRAWRREKTLTAAYPATD